MERTFSDDFEQGFQGWEYKFNTVASSRGDYPFITMTMGTGTGRFAKLASITMLNVRRKGQGKKGQKKPVLFPKIVFLYDENLHGPGKPLEDVFEAGILCSSRAMYPDWLSLTGEGYVPSMYKKYGAIVSPMGCRAFLSPWFERGGMKPADESDKPVFVGRWNIGAVSLHLPMILRQGTDRRAVRSARCWTTIWSLSASCISAPMHTWGRCVHLPIRWRTARAVSTADISSRRTRSSRS